MCFLTHTHTEVQSSKDSKANLYIWCLGLGMYESPLFLAAHDEDGGGRSVPTTPLQVAAPGNTGFICSGPSVFVCRAVFTQTFGLAPSVTVFTESLPSDSAENITSQSVPMVSASTGMAPADERDEVFVDQEEEEG